MKCDQCKKIWRFGFHGAAAIFYTMLLSSFMSNGYVVLVERMISAWYLILHVIFVFLLILQDLSTFVMNQYPRINSNITKINNILFISIVFPYALYIPLAYWTLFYFDSKLIHPIFLEMTMPPWVSKCSHSIILVVALLEMMTTTYTYKGNYIVALSLLAIFSGCYVTCLIRTFSQFGFWIYPVFHFVPKNMLPLVFVSQAVLLICIFFMGLAIAHSMKSKETSSEKNNEALDKLNSQTPTNNLPPKPPRSFQSPCGIYSHKADYDSNDSGINTRHESENSTNESSIESIENRSTSPSPGMDMSFENDEEITIRRYQKINRVSDQTNEVATKEIPFFYHFTGNNLDNDVPKKEPKIHAKQSVHSLDIISSNRNENHSSSKIFQKLKSHRGDQKTNMDEKLPTINTVGNPRNKAVHASKSKKSKLAGNTEGQPINKRYSHLRDFARDKGDSTIIKFYNECEKFASNTLASRTAASSPNTKEEPTEQIISKFKKASEDPTGSEDLEYQSHKSDFASQPTPCVPGSSQPIPWAVPQNTKHFVSFAPRMNETAEKFPNSSRTQEEYSSHAADPADSLEPFPLMMPLGHNFPATKKDHETTGIEEVVMKKNKFKSVANLCAVKGTLAETSISGNLNLPLYGDQMEVTGKPNHLAMKERFDDGSKLIMLNKINFLMQRRSRIPKRKAISGEEMEHTNSTMCKSQSTDGLIRLRGNAFSVEQEQGEPISGDNGKSTLSNDMILRVTLGNSKKKGMKRKKDSQSDAMTVCLVVI